MPAIRLKLSELLEERGLTRYRLAEGVKQEAGLSQAAVYAILRGEIMPRIDTLSMLMVALEKETGKPVSLSDVLDYDLSAPTPSPPRAFSRVGKKPAGKE